MPSDAGRYTGLSGRLLRFFGCPATVRRAWHSPRIPAVSPVRLQRRELDRAILVVPLAVLQST